MSLQKDVFQSQPLAPVNVTFFGNRVFAGVTKFRQGP